MNDRDKKLNYILNTYSCNIGHSSKDDSQENWKYIIRTFTDGIENKKILDVGCGSGKLITSLSINSKYSIGLDSSHSFKRHLQDSRKCDFIRGDCHQSPFKNESFDLIICIGTLEHVMNYEMAIIEMKRILKSNGFAFFFFGPSPIWKYLDSKGHRMITVENIKISKVLKLLNDGQYRKVQTFNIKYRLTAMKDFKIRCKNKLLEKILNNFFIKRLIIISFFLLEKMNLEQNAAVIYKKI